MKFYKLKGPHIWGDYGRELVAGEANNLVRQNGLLLLDRTGPFAPPITNPRNVIIVTEAFRRRLEENFEGLEFRPVIKDRIVEIHWETWDRTVFPQESPPGDGEPEDYLYGNPHSPAAAEALGDLWELVLSVGAQVRHSERPEASGTGEIDSATWTGDHFFWVIPGLFPVVVVSETAKTWLEAEVPQWVSFKEYPSSQ